MDNPIQNIILHAADLKTANPQLRWGQSIFNATYELYPAQADLYRGTISDCFYRDDLVDEFLKQIENTITI